MKTLFLRIFINSRHNGHSEQFIMERDFLCLFFP